MSASQKTIEMQYLSSLQTLAGRNTQAMANLHLNQVFLKQTSRFVSKQGPRCNSFFDLNWMSWNWPVNICEPTWLYGQTP